MNSHKLSLSDLVAKWRGGRVWTPDQECLPGDRILSGQPDLQMIAHCCADELEAALAQQAQPKCDECSRSLNPPQCPKHGDKPFPQQAQPNFMEQGLALYDKYRPDLNAGLNMQPEMPTRETILTQLVRDGHRNIASMLVLETITDAVLALFAPKETHPAGEHRPMAWRDECAHGPAEACAICAPPPHGKIIQKSQ